MKRPNPQATCRGCGINISDGYCIGCQPCNDRRHTRLRRGDRYSITAYPGELIDNATPTGRLVAGHIPERRTA